MIGGVSALLAVLFYLLQPDTTPAPSVRMSGPSAVSQAEVRLGPFSFVQTRDGAPAWKLTARQGRVFEKEQRADMRGVSATIHSARGWTLTLEGDAGVFDLATKNFSLTREKPMYIQTHDGYTLRVSSALTWLNGPGTIVATGPVRLQGPQIEINGQRLTVLVDAQEVTVSGDVQARVY